ncbi:MAG: glycosyltransferase family 4 protein [Oligoflexales bacterium]|nr:glycosyltransferase family 4 protein [Oligoflexales bacterium]
MEIATSSVAVPDLRPTIWHLLSNRWNSAITEYALSSARALRDRGHRSVFSPLQNSLAEKRALSAGLEVMSFKNFSPSAIPQVRSVNKDIKASVVFTYGGPETFLTKFIQSEARIIRFIGQDIENPAKFQRSWSYSHVEQFITPNEQLEAKLNAGYQHSSRTKPITKIYLGLDSEVFRYGQTLQNFEAEISLLKSSRPKLVLLGRLDPIKGHDKFFSIFAHLIKLWERRHPAQSLEQSPLLCIIGEPANLTVAHLEEMIKNHRLEQHVLFYPKRVHELGAILNQAHIGVISSLGSEQICRVAHEFSLCGVPLFVSGVGATEEALLNSEFGVSYKSCKDDLETAEALYLSLEKSLKEQESQRRQRADEAKQIFSLKAMGKSLENIFS